MSPMELPPVSPAVPAQPVHKVDPDARHGGLQRREPRREQAQNPLPADPTHVDTYV
jgi:hypothetical protein